MNILATSGTRAFVLLLSFLVAGLLPQGAIAQIELDSSGRVGIGSASPSSVSRVTLKTANTQRGLTVNMDGIGTSNAYGVYSYIANGYADYRYAVYGKVEDSSNLSYGLWGSATGATTLNVGAYGYASGGATTYGVYGWASGATTNWAGYFAGSAYSTGTFVDSDSRLKKDISILSTRTALDDIMKLSPRKYDFLQNSETDALGYPDMNLPSGEHIGLIAQELQEIYPNLVKSVPHVGLNQDGTPNGKEFETLAVNYTELIPVLIAAMQEQQAQIEALQAAVRGAGIDLPDANGQK